MQVELSSRSRESNPLGKKRTKRAKKQTSSPQPKHQASRMGSISTMPASALVLPFDYLPAVGLMNCRQVCKSWLGIIESKPHLWDYFFLPSQYHEGSEWKHSFKQNMIEILTEKSGALVEIDIQRDLEEDGLEYAIGTPPDDFIKTLLKSKKKLQRYAYKPTEQGDAKLSTDILFQFQNLVIYLDVPEDQGDRGKPAMLEVRPRKNSTPVSIMNPALRTETLLTTLYLNGSFWDEKAAMDILRKASVSSLVGVENRESFDLMHLISKPLSH